MIKVPVLGLRMGKRHGVGIHSCKSVDDELVRRGRFSNFLGKGSIEHINVQMGEKNLQGIILGGIHRVLAGEGIGRAHGRAGGMVPFQVVVLEEHLPVGLLT